MMFFYLNKDTIGDDQLYYSYSCSPQTSPTEQRKFSLKSVFKETKKKICKVTVRRYLPKQNKERNKQKTSQE